jgi:hypothetical protein
MPGPDQGHAHTNPAFMKSLLDQAEHLAGFLRSNEVVPLEWAGRPRLDQSSIALEASQRRHAGHDPRAGEAEVEWSALLGRRLVGQLMGNIPDSSSSEVVTPSNACIRIPTNVWA